MTVIDLTASANWFGRTTGILRAELEIARAFVEAQGPDISLVFWSDAKGCFEAYDGPLEPETVKAARLAKDLAIAREAFLGLDPSGPGFGGGSGGGRAMVVAGNAWSQNTRFALGCIEFARAAGLRLVVYLHDMIPVLLPDHYEAAYVGRFVAGLRLLLGAEALLACNSRSTRDDLLRWCGEEGLPMPHAFVAHLGDRFAPAGAGSAGPVPERWEVLAVGAIHRRKNYALLAEVWRRLNELAGARCPHLLIVGGVTREGAWQAQEFRTDPVLARHVEILPQLTDAELAALYRRAALVAYPSRYEGWGLPVAEALAFGRVCLASRVGGIPEIADLGEDLLPPDDPGAWAARILHYLENPEARLRREAELRQAYVPRSWSGTVAAIRQGIAQAKPPAGPRLPSGAEVHFREPEASRYLAAPMHPPEDWGRWAQGRVARLSFQADAGTEEPQVLQLGLVLPSPALVRVSMNGRTALERSGEAGASLHHLPLPRDGSGRDLVVEVTSDILAPPERDTLPPQEARLVAIGLSHMALMPLPRLRRAAEERTATMQGVLSLVRDVPGCVRLLAGRAVAEGWQARDGHLAFRLARACPPLASLRCTAYLSTTSRGPLRFLLRCNGRQAVSQLVPPRRGDSMACDFAIGPEGLDHALFELVLLEAGSLTPVAFTLNDLFVPSWAFDLAPPDLARPQAGLSLGQFHKFGAEMDANQAGLLRAGWTMARFGAEATGTAIVSGVLEGVGTANDVKLNCKVTGDAETEILFEVNGRTQPMMVGPSAGNLILPLPGPLPPGGLMSLRCSLPASAPGLRLVLRALQVL